MQRQSLYMVQFPVSAPRTQIEDFPAGTARSVSGALHIVPGGTKKITKSELDHLQQTQIWGRQIRIIKKFVPAPGKSEPSERTKDKKMEEVLDAADTASKGGGNRSTKKQVSKSEDAV